MRVAVIGAGALGGFFGGLLQARGHELHYIVRGKTYQILCEQGLKIKGEPYDTELPQVNAHLSSETVGPVDLVLLGVRSDQVLDVAGHLPALIGPETLVITMQNGVLAPDQVAAVVGKEHTAPGIARIFNRLDGPGRVLHMGGFAGFTFATFDNGDHPLLAQLREEYSECGLICRVHPNIYHELWSKAMYMVPFGTLGGLSTQPMGVLRSELREQFTGICQEIIEVAKAKGVELPDDVLEKTMVGLDKYDPASTSSMQRDILAGRTSEMDGLVGGIIRIADQFEVQIPKISLVYDLLMVREHRIRGEI